MDGLIDNLRSIFALVTSTPAAAMLSAVGFLLLPLAVWIAVRGLKSDDVTKTPFWQKTAFFVCLIGGVLFSAAGPSVALFAFAKNPVGMVSPAKAFDNLETNVRVHWLIRLIPFGQQNRSQLAIGSLKQLGPPEQQYTFVGAYDELVGYGVDDAIRMLGGTFSDGQHVSAVIFPIQDNLQVYPANARGLLQVVQKVEMRDSSQITTPLLKGTGALGKAASDDLPHVDALAYWAWPNYRDLYPEYCRLAQTFRCDSKYSAHRYVGPVNIDWHPLGFAQKNATQDSCSLNPVNYCAVSDWKSAEKNLSNNFGARIFLIENMSIDQIPNRVLIEFGDPSHQIIPDIGFRFGRP
jgi:hypothetical protein